MTILFVTGHPAQIHNFRIVKQLLEKEGHKVVWASSKKDISFELLELYGIQAIELSRPKKSTFSKIVHLISNSLKIVRLMKREKVDIVVSRVSPYAAIASKIRRKKHIGLADTEVSGIYDTIFSKFIDVLITSTTFGRELTKNQLRIPSNIELFYLHPNHFVPDHSIYSLLGIPQNANFALLRFINWDAYHDQGIQGLTIENKLRIVNEMSALMPVFISSEGELPKELEQFRLTVPYDKIHSVLNHASLFFGEGASMAAEAAILGTPSVFVNSIWSGNGADLEKYGLFFQFKSNLEEQEKAIKQAIFIAKKGKENMGCKQKQSEYLKDKIDASEFLKWFIVEFPESNTRIITNPEFIKNFN